jgi:cyclohexadieny/prephenate dehydrogenase
MLFMNEFTASDASSSSTHVWPRTVAIYGVGLLGGSLGAALRAAYPGVKVLGVGRDPLRLAGALERGLVTRVVADGCEAAAEADLLIICTPVDRIATDITSLSAACRPGTIITDVGSVKNPLAVDLNDLVGDVEYVGSHPIAGSEKRGFEHATPDLFRGRVCVVTPRSNNTPAAIDRVSRVWTDLGMRVCSMTAAAHDEALARTSHAPHLVASVLSHTLDASLISLVGTGFRDTTRIAAGDPELWTAIFVANRDAVLEAVDEVQKLLAMYREAVDRGDVRQLTRLLAEAKYRRELLTPLAREGAETERREAVGATN